MTDAEERIAALVMEVDEVSTSPVERAVHLVAAMRELHRSGYALLLVAPGTTVKLELRRRAWWWRRNRRSRDDRSS